MKKGRQPVVVAGVDRVRAIARGARSGVAPDSTARRHSRWQMSTEEVAGFLYFFDVVAPHPALLEGETAYGRPISRGTH
jgi:hypothetical protein